MSKRVNNKRGNRVRHPDRHPTKVRGGGRPTQAPSAVRPFNWGELVTSVARAMGRPSRMGMTYERNG